MLFQIYDYYKKELGNENLVFKTIKFWLYSIFILPIIYGIAIVLTSINNSVFFTLVFFVSMILSIVLLFFIVNNKAKKVINRYYGIPYKKGMWNSNDALIIIRKHEKEMMLKYLKEIDNKIDEIDIKELSDSATIEAENLKTKFPIIPSFFAALFISLWNNFLSWIYKSDVIENLNSAILIFSITSLVILMIIVLYIMVSTLYVSIKDEFIDKEQKKMRAFSKLLKEIHDDIERDKRRI